MRTGAKPLQKSVSDAAEVDGTVAAAFAQIVIDTALSRGVTLEALAAALGWPDAQLRPLPELLAQSRYLQLLDAARQLSQDPHFGLHAGQRVRPATYSVLGYMLMSRENLGQALLEVLHYERLVHQLGTTSLVEESGQVAVVWSNHCDRLPCARDLAEFTFSGLLTCATWLAGRSLPVTRVDFTHAPPPDLQPLRALFGTALHFRQPENRLLVPAAVAAWPVTLADTSMLPVLHQYADRLLQDQKQSNGLVTQVRRLLLTALPRDGANLPTMAARLGMAPRTLQRRLQAAGANFQKLVDELRQQQARQYLGDPALSLTEIAYLLGYKNQSAFNHAFRGWTGCTPLEYRRDS